MSKKMKIIPVFVPHKGCPNDCVFCNQRRITGKGNVDVNEKYAINIVEEYIKTIEHDTLTEIAFFGGSFTAIDLDLQKELLEVGKYYKDKGIVHKIRISTRPDSINDEILDVQKRYGVDIIELGIQSLNEEVLKKSNRGHTVDDCKKASELIKRYEIVLGHQVMPGLPGSDMSKDIMTCEASIAMKPDIVRIYPTLVIKDTELSDMYKRGEYEPLTVEKAVEISALIYAKYMKNHINVIRIGLQTTETINENNDVLAGPFHPAFRQLVEEKIYLKSMIKSLTDTDKANTINSTLKILTNDKIISYLSGQNKSNIIKLKEIFGIKNISFGRHDDENKIEIYKENKEIGSFLKSNIFENYLKDFQQTGGV